LLINSNSSVLQFNVGNLPIGQIGVPYNSILTASGGAQPYVWAISSSALPSGWSLNASTGMISGTSPQVLQTGFTVQVSDSSRPAQTARQNFKLIVADKLQIASSALVSGTAQIPYSITPIATGGVPPYSWRISAGSLPEGLSLNQSLDTRIIGVPSLSGSFPFRLQVSDMSLQSASANFNIDIAEQSDNRCGPPVYCARSDRDVVQETSMAPPLVNVVFEDPDFNSRMVRVTNPDVLTNFGLPGVSFKTNSSSEQNTWNTDSTRFYVIGDGGNFLLYSFEADTMQATWNPIPGTPRGNLPIQGDTFSRTNPNIVYGQAKSPDQVIGAYDISTNALTDVVATTGCVPGLKASSHMGDVSVSAADQRFLTYEGGSEQDTDMFIVVYDNSTGCRWYNTSTGEIGGQWGPTGQASSTTSFLVHNARIAISGEWAVIDPVNTKYKVMWQIGTLNVATCAMDKYPFCGGHNVGGYNSYVNSSGYLDDMNILVRPFSNLSSAIQLVSPLPTVVERLSEKHWSWNDDNLTDTMPVCGSTDFAIVGYSSITWAWDREIICLRTDGVQSEVWRFGHTRSIYNGDFWSTPRGNVSQDGRFFMFTSTWDNQLGSQKGSTTLFREDVFIVELR
jgi:hypothetical protein